MSRKSLEWFSRSRLRVLPLSTTLMRLIRNFISRKKPCLWGSAASRVSTYIYIYIELPCAVIFPLFHVARACFRRTSLWRLCNCAVAMKIYFRWKFGDPRFSSFHRSGEKNSRFSWPLIFSSNFVALDFIYFYFACESWFLFFLRCEKSWGNFEVGINLRLMKECERILTFVRCTTFNISRNLDKVAEISNNFLQKNRFCHRSFLKFTKYCTSRII